MKQLFTILLLITFSTILFAQNYKLFNSTAKKLFSTYPEQTNTYSMSFDSVATAGSDSVYYNFYRIDSLNFISYDCDFWVGPECYKQNIPVWIGRKIDFNNLNSYNFYPNNGDTIQFNFNPIFGDTSVFYKDENQKFSLTYEGSDTITVLSYSDSARFFKIRHTDLSGNVIYSQLHGQNIIIAKNLGLIQFFQVDQFPQLLNPIYLIGDLQYNLGIVNLTRGMLYDYQPGDEIQYKESSWDMNGPPWENYTLFKKHIILSRTETNDSLIYEIDESVFYEDSSFIISNTISKIYLKNYIVAQLPFEVFDGSYKQFSFVDYCGIYRWTFFREPDLDLSYCEIDNVWGYFDYGGPPPTVHSTYVVGIGDYLSSSNNIYSSSSSQIVYFYKDGIPCGDEVLVNISENETNTQQIQVYPNPTNEILQIRAVKSNYFLNFELQDIFGKIINVSNINSKEFVLDVGDLPAGLYLYLIREKNEIIQQGKLIIK